MRAGETVFVDTGAWLALALAQDPLHARARATWEDLATNGARRFTSVPVVIETFTFLDRNATRDAALTWKDALATVDRLEIVDVTREDLRKGWDWFRRRELHKLSAVDATSFVLMKRMRIHAAFAFDHHFAAAGFRLVG